MSNQVVPVAFSNQHVVVAPVRIHSSSVLADPQQFEMNMRAAEVFAKSDLVPAHYRGKPANCFIAINRAQRLGVDELYFLERTYVLSGRLGLYAELAIELANSSGRFKGPITFHLHGEGDTRACTAKAILAATGECIENTVTYAMAKADGWTKNSKWQSLRDQMLQYRAGVFLSRLYAGGAMGGLYTKEELEDVAAQTKPLDEVKQRLLADPAVKAEYDAMAGEFKSLPAPEPAPKPAAVPLWERESYRLPTKRAGKDMAIDDWFGVFAKAADAAPTWKAWTKLCDDNVLMVEALQGSKEHSAPFAALDDRMQEKHLRPDDDVSGEPAPETQEEMPL